MLYFDEILGILSKVKGEDKFLSKRNKFYKFLSLASFAGTIAVSSVYYKENTPNAYEIKVFDKAVAYVKADENALKQIAKINNELENRFKSTNFKDSIFVFNSKVNEDYLIDDKLLEKSIIQNGGIEVEAFSMLCDGKEIAIVASQMEGKEALDKVANYYASKNGVNIKESNVKNKITYEKKKTLLKDVDDVDKVKERIIEVNSKLKKPLLVIEFKGTSQSTKNISPETITKSSNSILEGQSQIENQGKYGEKIVLKEITMQNNNIIDSKVISEKVTIPPVNKVILKGTKSNENKDKTASTSFVSPSRGTISSNFGMRWGRMHEGLDIAANLGEPIYAALDGTVTYSGWASGYGNLIKLKHNDGIDTYYGHCSKLLVSEGQKVKKGEKIAEVGSTGNSTGPHLHFEIRINGVPKDPTKYLNDIKNK